MPIARSVEVPTAADTDGRSGSGHSRPQVFLWSPRAARLQSPRWHARHCVFVVRSSSSSPRSSRLLRSSWSALLHLHVLSVAARVACVRLSHAHRTFRQCHQSRQVVTLARGRHHYQSHQSRQSRRACSRPSHASTSLPPASPSPHTHTHCTLHTPLRRARGTLLVAVVAAFACARVVAAGQPTRRAGPRSLRSAVCLSRALLDRRYGQSRRARLRSPCAITCS